DLGKAAWKVVAPDEYVDVVVWTRDSPVEKRVLRVPAEQKHRRIEDHESGNEVELSRGQVHPAIMRANVSDVENPGGRRRCLTAHRKRWTTVRADRPAHKCRYRAVASDGLRWSCPSARESAVPTRGRTDPLYRRAGEARLIAWRKANGR